jgi:hypothetical protein
MQKNLQFSYLFNYLLIFNSQFEDFRLQMKVLITKEKILLFCLKNFNFFVHYYETLIYLISKNLWIE